MRRPMTMLLGLGAALAIAGSGSGPVLATPASGFAGTTLAVGRFGDIAAFNKLLPPDFRHAKNRELWLSWQRTQGDSDVYVQSNVWAPGGDTGWHTHPGHSLIIVTAGTVTTYDGHDPTCAPHVYTAGMGFVDPGGDHVHTIRNETTAEARTITIQVIPAGSTRRVDASDPGRCAF